MFETHAGNYCRVPAVTLHRVQVDGAAAHVIALTTSWSNRRTNSQDINPNRVTTFRGPLVFDVLHRHHFGSFEVVFEKGRRKAAWGSGGLHSSRDQIDLAKSERRRGKQT